MTTQIGRAFGTQPLPHVLYIYDRFEFDRNSIEHIASGLAQLVPTWLICNHGELTRVRQAGFNLAVIFGSPPKLDESLHTIQIGGVSTTLQVETMFTDHYGRDGTYLAELYREDKSFARVWQVPFALDDEYQKLIIRDLVPLVPRGNVDPKDFNGETPVLSIRTLGRWQTAKHLQPLLVDADGKVFALRTTGAMPWHWVLPKGANPVLWVPIVLRDLHSADPNAFPVRTSWSEDFRYLTMAERVATEELADIAAKRIRIERELNEQQTRVLQEQLKARNA
ncbi:MAG: hypothetical protein JO144_15170, partial [Actinobacteria bacterium]|nr:hypothetical protein [Actinomycetota bacterium]